ncbi:MAG TPA: hypothetical protein VEV87_07615 [Chitinophagaceae bacterium]|nr:hypothetical protein [Chitinophagaceae bacterium]
MRQSAFLLAAALSLTLSLAAQKAQFFPKLRLERSIDIENINKPKIYFSSSSSDKDKPKQVTPSYQPRRGTDFPSLQHQLGSDIQYFKMDRRNKVFQDLFQGMFQGFIYKNRPGL